MVSNLSSRLRTQRSCCILACLAGIPARAATFSLSPGSIASMSTNAIVLSIDGLASQQQVLVEEFRDTNGNGSIEPGEQLVLSFKLSDGELPPFVGPVGEGNPGDDDGATNSQIRK